MFDDAQKQYINVKIMAIGTKTGQDITGQINNLQNERKEINDSLLTLCQKRRCDVEKESEGDTTSIKLIRAQRENVDHEIKELCFTQFIKLSDVMDVLESLNRIPIPPRCHNDL
jgi:hypothetical protein